MSILALLLLSLTVGAYSSCLPNPLTPPAGSVPITIGENAWVSSEFNAHVAKILLEERMGISARVLEFPESLMGPFLANGSISACLEIWGKEYDETRPFIQSGLVNDGGLLGVVGRIGWYVPKYLLVQFPFAASLATATREQRETLFAAVNHTLLYGPRDWMSYEPAIISMNNYSLTIKETTDETALMTEIKAKYAAREAFIFYLWTPHSAFASMNITRVMLPVETGSEKCEGGPIEKHYCDYPAVPLRKGYNPGLSRSNHKAFLLFSGMVFSNEDHINALANVDLRGMTVQQAACDWLLQNSGLWSTWIPPADNSDAPTKSNNALAVGLGVGLGAAVLCLVGALAVAWVLRRRARVLAQENARLHGMLKTDVLDTPAEKVLSILEHLHGRKNKLIRGSDLADIEFVMHVVASRKLNKVDASDLSKKGVDGDVQDYLRDTVLRKADLESNVEAATKASKFLVQQLQPNRVPELENNIRIVDLGLLEGKLDEWDCDVIALDEQVSGHALSVIGMHLVEKSGVLSALGLDAVKFHNFVVAAEARYEKANPYHNSVHAADVTQACYFFIRNHTRLFSDIQVLALLVAAIVHDLGHPGKNNNWLVATKHGLATLYNDSSVLENHHVSQAFQLLYSSPEVDFTAGLSADLQKSFRHYVIQLVLATDMSRHVEILSDLKSALSISTPLPMFSASRKLSMSQGSSSSSHGDLDSEMLVLRVVLKAADVFNTGRPWDVAQKWAHRAADEFFAQGDEEKRLGLPVSPMMSRETTQLARMQSAFIEYVTMPFADVLSKTLPPIRDVLRQMVTNREMWLTSVPLSARHSTATRLNTSLASKL